MATQYVINFTDPTATPFLINPYTSNGPASPISPAPAVARTSLFFYGKGSPNYGERLEENFVNLLESFSSPASPVQPISGQLWFHRNDVVRTTAGWYLWSDTSSTWSTLTVNTIGVANPNTLGTPVSVGGAPYKIGSTGLLFFGVTIVGHPLFNQWIQYNYTNLTTTYPAITDPNTSSVIPEKFVRVYDGNTWNRLIDPWAAPTSPSAPVGGTLWFDTTVNALKFYDGTVFTTLLSSASLGAYVLKAGDTMTGVLNMSANFVSGVADPVLAQDAATKNYVDTEINNAVVGISLSLDDLTDVSITTPVLAQTLRYSGTEWVNSALQTTDLIGVTASNTEVNNVVGTTGPIQAQLDDRVLKSGDTMTGFLTLNADPSAALHAATKQYTDGQDIVSGSVDTLSNVLTLTRGNSGVINIPNVASTSFAPLYFPEPDEILATLASPPGDVVQAVHQLDKAVKRRTTPQRSVVLGTTGAGLTYLTPIYEAGTNKLFVFVDGVKFVASTAGSQRVQFTLSPTGSPPTADSLDCVTDPGLTNSALTYTTTITVDGGAGQVISITGDSPEAFSYCSVLNAINDQLAGATAVLEDEAIVIYSDSQGTGSTISIVDGATPLFASMDNFSAILGAVPGVTYGYNEVGAFGTLSNEIIFQGDPDVVDSTTIEFIVLGEAGFPYV